MAWTIITLLSLYVFSCLEQKHMPGGIQQSSWMQEQEISRQSRETENAEDLDDFTGPPSLLAITHS